MPERLLEAFREDAERITRRPPFELIEAAGRARRRRRHAMGGAVAACLLTVTGLLAATTGDSPTPQPAEDPDPRSDVTPWPGPTMTTVAEGTYEFRYSTTPESPLVRVTVPAGWNSWLGPNRFEGLGREVTSDGSNEDVYLQGPDWYAGLLVLEVQWVAQRGCSAADVRDGDARTLVRALTEMPRFRVSAGPTGTTHDGHPATHLRLHGLGDVPNCSRDAILLTAQGAIGGGAADTSYDVRVIDTGVGAVVVWAEWSRGTPRRDVHGLLGMVDSVEIAD